MWSRGKQEWCCTRFSVGCHTEVLTTIEPYDCHVGTAVWQVLWSERRKQWCCAHHLRGCEVEATTPAPSTEPFDCWAGFSNWKDGWSHQKKCWCCKHYRMGCPPEKSTTEPFDCEAGLANWQRGWSSEKQDWCCRAYRQGCPGPGLDFSVEADLETTADPGNCFSGSSDQWTCEKRHRCCSLHSQGCESASSCADPYDCRNPTYVEGKWAWCCKHEGIGCHASDLASMGQETLAEASKGLGVQGTWSSMTLQHPVRKFELTRRWLPALDRFMLPSVVGSLGLAIAALLAMHTCSGAQRSRNRGGPHAVAEPQGSWSPRATSAHSLFAPSRQAERPLGYAPVSVEDPDW